MKCNRVGFDNWDGVIDTGDQLSNPSKDQIKALILALDGRKRTLLTLYSDPGSENIVIGGGNGSYIAYATTYDEHFVSALSQELTGRTFQLVAGGQEGQFDEAMKLSLQQVLQIANDFAETGRLADVCTWVEQ